MIFKIHNKYPETNYIDNELLSNYSLNEIIDELNIKEYEIISYCEGIVLRRSEKNNANYK